MKCVYPVKSILRNPVQEIQETPSKVINRGIRNDTPIKEYFKKMYTTSPVSTETRKDNYSLRGNLHRAVPHEFENMLNNF